ncbi:MAG: exodeoxyribonuclease VII large subunit, partial [Pseudomonadota bacterium]
AIRGFNAMPEGQRPDTLIVGRGGGSIEDLWPFNEENVVRAAFESQIPLISAVGHETDTTLIDYVSDARAPTPTGAAEIAVPVRAELLVSVDELGQRTRRGLLRLVQRMHERTGAVRLPAPERLLQTKQQSYDHAATRLQSALRQATAAKRVVFSNVAAALRVEPLRADRRRRLAMLRAVAERARPALNRVLARHRERLQAHGQLLDTLSHHATLKRGFAIVRDAKGKTIRSIKAGQTQDRLTVDFADGSLEAVPVSTDKPALAKPSAPKPAAKPKPRAKAKPDQGSLF